MSNSKASLGALRRLPQTLLIALVRAYRLLLSPWLGNGCRFEPTCSVYALQALEQHGAACGSYLTLRRLVRCQPWCAGGHDHVPVVGGAGLFSFFDRRADSVAPPVISSPSTKIPS